MKLIIDRRTLLLASSAALITRPSFAEATAHEVQMLNKDPDDPKKRMLFKPNIIVVQPGDSVNFVSTDRGHNCETIDGMMPSGGEEWKSKLNDDIEVMFNQPGFYGYKCTPHVGQGMVGLVIVEGDGKMDNYEDAKGVRHRGGAKKAFNAIWDTVEADGLAA